MTERTEHMSTIGRAIDRAAVAIRALGQPDLAALEEAANLSWVIRDQIMREEREAQNRREQAARVTVRTGQVWDHINAMRAERQGWGPEAMLVVHETAMSWCRARALYLDQATEVWIDGGTGFSFGGVIGGTTFGCIARQCITSTEPQPDKGWLLPAYEWTFHS